MDPEKLFVFGIFLCATKSYVLVYYLKKSHTTQRDTSSYFAIWQAHFNHACTFFQVLLTS